MHANDVGSYWDQMRSTVMPFFERHEQGVLLGRGGVSVRNIHLPPDASKRNEHSCTLVFIPGRTESFFKYAETFYDLAQHGHEIFAMDHRGQGFSERLLADPQIGYVQDFHDYEVDLVSFLTTVVAAKKSFSRVFIVAHSMGAAISIKMILGAQQGRAGADLARFMCDFSGLILSAPMLAIRLGFGQWATEMVLGARCLLGKGKKYATTPGQFDAATYGTDLTHSMPRLSWYRAALAERPELQLGMPSNQWMLEAIRFCAALRAELEDHPLACPVLLLSPGRDSVVEVEAQRLISQSFGGRVLERINLPQSAHDPFIEVDEVRSLVLQSIEQFVSLTESAAAQAGPGL
jgi:lysophospholipase